MVSLVSPVCDVVRADGCPRLQLAAMALYLLAGISRARRRPPASTNRCFSAPMKLCAGAGRSRLAYALGGYDGCSAICGGRAS